MAALEEYLQQLYVENYDNLDPDKTELAGLMDVSSDIRSYFYSSKDDFQKGDYLFDTNGNVINVIRISKLPKDIREQLVGGTVDGLATAYDNTPNEENRDKLYVGCVNKQDIYGVTSDLKVYYCSTDGTVSGQANLDKADDNAKVLDNTSALWSLFEKYDVNPKDGKLAYGEVRSITTLNVSDTELSKLTNFKDLYSLPNLEYLYINRSDSSQRKTRVDNINLDGVQNCPKLKLVWFYNATAEDYSYLAKVKKLESLIFYNINDSDLNKICGTSDKEEEKGKGINKYDLNLKYFGVVGDVENINSTSLTTHSTKKSSNTITSTTPFANLSTATKKSVEYMNLQNNNIVDLSGLKGYTGIKLLRCEYNSLISLDGIEGADSLTYLCAANNSLGGTTPEESRTDSITTNLGGTAIKALKDKKKLAYLCLQNNPNLANASWLVNCTNLASADLTGCSKTMLITEFEGEGKLLAKMGGSNLKLPVASYDSDTFDIETQNLKSGDGSYTASQITDSILLGSPLYGNTNIKKLNLSGCTNVTQKGWTIFLESLGQVQYLKLEGCTGLTNLDWISKADFREQKAWFSHYYVDVNGTKTEVNLGPTFNVGTTEGDDNLSVSGYYYKYSKDTNGNRILSNSAGEEIGTCSDGTKWKSLGPGEPYFTAYKYEAYQYSTDKKTYKYMVNQYDYSYDSNATIDGHSGLNSQTSLIELDIRNTSIRDYTPLNGLIASAKGSEHKLDLDGQHTLDGDTASSKLDETSVKDGEISYSKTYSSNDSTLKTLRISDGLDFKNIIPSLNRLESAAAYNFWCRNKKNWGAGINSGLILEYSTLVDGLTYCKNYQYMKVNQLDGAIEMGASYFDLRYTSLISSSIQGIKGYFYFPNIINSNDILYGGNALVEPNSNYLYLLKCFEPGTYYSASKYSEFFERMKNANNLTKISFGPGPNCTSFANYLLVKLPNILTVAIDSQGNKNVNSLNKLTNLNNFTNLKRFSLDATHDRLDIRQISNCPTISELKLKNNNITSLSGLKDLAINQSSRNTAIISELDSYQCIDTETGTTNTNKFSELEDKKEIRWLNELDISKNNLQNLYELRNLTHLTSLNLSNNPGIGDTFYDESTKTTYNTIDFLIELADKCKENNGKNPITINLSGTSITNFGELGKHCNLVTK